MSTNAIPRLSRVRLAEHTRRAGNPCQGHARPL